MKKLMVLALALAVTVTAVPAFAQGTLEIFARAPGNPATEARIWDVNPGETFEIVVYAETSGLWAHEWEALVPPELQTLFDSFQAFATGVLDPQSFVLGQTLETVRGEPINLWEVISGVGEPCPPGRLLVASFLLTIQVPVANMIIPLGPATHGEQVEPIAANCGGNTADEYAFDLPQPPGRLRVGDDRIDFPAGSLLLSPTFVVPTEASSFGSIKARF